MITYALRTHIMDKEDIQLDDIYRILFGNAPVLFLVEIVIRSIITYIILLAVIRGLGKRMSGQLSFTEMAVMLMLGAIVSSSMQIPERGILEGCFVLALVLIIQRLITLYMFKNDRLEDKVLGQMYLLVKDGMLQPRELAREYVSRNQIFGILRSKNVTNLGMVKRLYLETSGDFTMYLYEDERPGLSLLPREDEELFNAQQLVNDQKVCNICGQIYEIRQVPDQCENCQSREFVQPVQGDSLNK
ncbi:DUF421 domain-containing protein [Longitalea luteola]|uniref:DUF421 domain-containing protein n=1 Tax=Longitalea luteola TaxID=2812563 RepID=UPI001A97B14F|nr:YetF domain-containing protein [Longitalea luteola]